MACVPVECAVSSVSASRARKTRRSMCRCPAAIIPHQPVESALTDIQREELANAYGIKGVPLLSALGSLRFPQSFPYDFMHLIWALDPADVKSIVGRVEDRGIWGLVDRSGLLAHAVFTEAH
jgi:hypothetical protein